MNTVHSHLGVQQQIPVVNALYIFFSAHSFCYASQYHEFVFVASFCTFVRFF